MTIHDISTQLHSLAVDHRLNGERFSKRELEHYIANMFRSNLKANDKLVMEISLPDGNWLFTIERFGEGADCFDYNIPDNREQEERIWSLIA